MATQRPGGTRSTHSSPRAPGKAPNGASSSAAGKSGARPAATARDGLPRKDSARERDLGADTTIWHTRGLQTNTRMRVPLVQRTPQRQLPPSPLPRLMRWAAVLAVALVCFEAVKHWLH